MSNCAVNLGVSDGECLAFYTPCTKTGCTVCMVGPGSLELCLACDVNYTLDGSDCKPPYSNISMKIALITNFFSTSSSS